MSEPRTSIAYGPGAVVMNFHNMPTSGDGWSPPVVSFKDDEWRVEWSDGLIERFRPNASPTTTAAQHRPGPQRRLDD